MAWYHASWLYRFKMTTDQTKVDEAIDNVFYDLANAPAAFWTHVKSDGGDIRVTTSDEVTEVAREVSGFNVGSTVGSLFLAATGLSASVDTDYYVYYGNSGASEPAAGATFGKQAVWTSYACVFHLDEASGNVTCSKSGVTGTNTGVSLGATGKVRTGGTWGANDLIACGDNFDLTGSFTLSAWINPTSTAGIIRILSKCDADGKNGYQWYVESGLFKLLIGDASGIVQTWSNAGLSASALQLLHVTYVSTNGKHYLNGALNRDETGMSGLAITGGASAFTIGNFSTSDTGAFTGVIDEVRVAASIRSATWISTEYNNQNAPASFWTTGAETQDSVTPPASLLWLPRQLTLRGPRGLMMPSGPIPPVTPEA